jgi:methylenetetrahydrofolate dehydrogenase (NADP+)/methenyltetrahydrofolate cyclohydrolase
VAGSITPVPGGVGPMTIACLLHNTARAVCQQKGVATPEMRIFSFCYFLTAAMNIT